MISGGMLWHLAVETRDTVEQSTAPVYAYILPALQQRIALPQMWMVLGFSNPRVEEITPK